MSSNFEWDKLRSFYHIAKTGSFTKSSKVLKLSQSGLSRQIIDLEYQVKEKLFLRHARGVILTEAGEILFKSVSKMMAEIESALLHIHEKDEQPTGTIKIATTSFFASVWIIDYISKFLEEYPAIRLEIIGKDDEPDLIRQESEVAIHPFIYDRPDLIQKYLKTWFWSLYASPLYLEKFGTPQNSSDLDNHQLICFGQKASKPFADINWFLRLGTKSGEERLPYLKVNSAHALMKAAQSNLGIVSLSEEHVALNGDDLVKILPEYKGPTVESYYIYPKQLESSKRVKALGDYLEKVMGRDNSREVTTAIKPMTAPNIK